MNLQAKRKNDHVVEALRQYNSQSHDDFLHTRFVHHSLTTTTSETVDFSTTLQTLTLHTPFFINAMTGGSKQTDPINEKLALVARETNIAMATGSNSIAMKDPATANGFKQLRAINPNGLLFANLGAHHSVDNAKKAISLLQADAIQIHLNTPQEMVMPEGDRQFSHWLNNIQTLHEQLNIPIIVKEVGFGMSFETMQLLQQAGATILDVSGRGGTNFVTIENNRREDKSYALLQQWGQTTLESLLETKKLTQQPTIIASGGIKNAHDIALCLALGAHAVGLSGQLLYTIQKFGVSETIAFVEQLKEQLKTIMTLLNAPTLAHLRQANVVLAPSLVHWANQRGIPIS